MIHDEGIEKAIDWLHSIVMEDNQVKLAVINGLRELQTARTDLTSLRQNLKEAAGEIRIKCAKEKEVGGFYNIGWEDSLNILVAHHLIEDEK